MKRGLLITLLSALAGGLTAYAVVNFTSAQTVQTVSGGDTAQFRTVSLAQDNYPDFTYAAESAVDAVVYVKVSSTQTMQRALARSLTFSSECLSRALHSREKEPAVAQVS